jgi:hypothetical protein
LKKIICAIMLLAISAGSSAQWGPPKLVSPVVEGNNITVRFKAPKAIKVELTGDFLPSKETKTDFGTFMLPAPVEMKEGKDGIPGGSA